ncbi:hypothetical protein D3C86_1334140 [compost metagenome]
MQQCVGAGHQAGHLWRRAELVDHCHIGRHGCRHRRANQQQVIAAAQAFHAVEQHWQVFFLGTAPGEDQQPGVVVQAQLDPQPGVSGNGIEGLQVDAQGLHEHIPDPKPGEFVGHDPTGRQDPVEVAVELADIGLDVIGHPVAHAVADQQRQVRVIETYDRYIELPPCIQRCPCGEVGVADFDQVRLQILQDIAPGRETQREAIAFAEGQGRGWNGEDAILLAQGRSGDQQTVANARLDAQATVLCIQISAHATAGRGVEHGDVSDMHDERSSGPGIPLVDLYEG